MERWEQTDQSENQSEWKSKEKLIEKAKRKDSRNMNSLKKRFPSLSSLGVSVLSWFWRSSFLKLNRLNSVERKIINWNLHFTSRRKVVFVKRKPMKREIHSVPTATGEFIFSFPIGGTKKRNSESVFIWCYNFLSKICLSTRYSDTEDNSFVITWVALRFRCQ